MLFQGWVGFTFRSSLRWGRIRPPLFEIEKETHVCFCGSRPRSYGTVMAEEAKKLAAYAAVDNHIQVGKPSIS